MKYLDRFPNLTALSRRSILLGVWLVLALSLISPASAQEETIPQLTVVAETLQIRNGPDATYPPFETLPQGRVVGVIGYNAETGWWQVVSSFGSPGWVSGGEANVSVNEAAIQRFAAPQPQTVTPAIVLRPAVGIIVFQASRGGPIYAINQDGSNLRYLTTGMDPALSPDGQWVAFTRWETSQDGALGNVWLINVDGTGERVIHENVHNPRTPTWSADGTRIAISMQHGGNPDVVEKCWGQRPPREAFDVSPDPDPDDRRDVEFCFKVPPDPHWGLRLIDVVTGAYEDLPGDDYSLSPALNPANSQQVVYDGDRALVSLDLTTNQTWPLLADPNAHSPVFSPDGSKIALSYWQSDHWEVQVMPAPGTQTQADAGGRVRLTQTSYDTFAQQILNGEMPHSHNNLAPTWSPDGSQIAFLTDRTGQWEIWVTRDDGSNQRPLFPVGTLDGINLQYNEYNNTDEQVLSWR